MPFPPSLRPLSRHSRENRNPCHEAEGVLKASGNFQPFDMDPGSMARGDGLLKQTGCVRADRIFKRRATGPRFQPRSACPSFRPLSRHSRESRNPCHEAEGMLKASGNLQPFDMDPGSMARGDGLLKHAGWVRPLSVIPGLTRNPCSSERDGGRPSGNLGILCYPTDPSSHASNRR